MKKQQTNVFIALSENELAVLTRQVKETMAKDFGGGSQKLFSPADLWNIHRNKRSISSRKFL